MGRSICYTDPKYPKAGEVSTWKFVYVTANDVPKGTLIKFDMLTQGDLLEWQLPQIDPKKK